MHCDRWATRLTLALLAAAPLAIAAGPTTGPDPVPVTLGRLPAMSLAPRPTPSAAQVARIRAVIASLATLGKPDLGLSPTLSGNGFAPLPDQGRADAHLLTDHALATSSALAELVRLGPDALPLLLDALDDPTPTRLGVRHDGLDGGMWFSDELSLNPVNPAERAACAARGGRQPTEDDTDQPYTVRVGDACFVAVGQIVGRPYEAVRYQPSNCIVINSTVHDAKLCAMVRSLWRSADARQMLFDSLRADYATAGISDGNTLDGWDLGSTLQCGAALRLLFYFPRESAPLLAQRLAKLDVRADADLDALLRRCLANGVRSEEFVKAVAWSGQPAVRAAVTDVFTRAGDFDTELAALPAVADARLLRQRLERQLDALPPDDGGPYGQGYRLLLALMQRSPDRARPAVDRYLKGGSAHRCLTVALLLQQAPAPWATDVLRPMLTDARPSNWGTYDVVPGHNDVHLPIRICDEAAITLGQLHPGLTFTLAGTHADLDRQIAAVRAAMDRGGRP